MIEEDLARRASRTARRALISAFAVALALVCGVGAERLHHAKSSAAAQADLAAAQALSERILREDEGLTTAAQLAAAGGQARWIERYDALLPQIQASIREAARRAPRPAAVRFDEQTRAANDTLALAEARVFELIREGSLAEARALLDSPAYAAHKRVLAQGTARLLEAITADVNARVQAVEARSQALLSALFTLTLVAFGALWRHLMRDLRRAERAHDDARQEVERLSRHDLLTGLPNRRSLNEHLERAAARADRDGDRLAVVVLNLCGLERLNETQGAAAVDRLLIDTARRLGDGVRKDEAVARLGGDEFAVVVQAGADDKAVLRSVQRLVALAAEPAAGDAGRPLVGASGGVALYPGDGFDLDDLVRKAQVAVARAKADSRGAIRFFQESMDAEVHARAALEGELRAALERGEIVPYFQPLIDLRRSRLSGFEVLARWRHPQRGIVAPDLFIPLAEEIGLIDALTFAVARQAMQVARPWQEELSIAINISPYQLKDTLLPQRIAALAAELDYPLRRLEVEITESALIGDIATAREIVAQFQRHGVRVALDDFGTGYSSLRHLAELGFDKIKIDRSFVHAMQASSASATIVNAVVGLGLGLEMSITAEGIEAPFEAERLATLGCRTGQGYLYSRPVPVDKLAELLKAEWGVPA